MEFNETSKLIDILKAYPELEQKLKAIDDRFNMISTPMGKILLKKYTVKDASKLTGIPVAELLTELDKLIKE